MRCKGLLLMLWTAPAVCTENLSPDIMVMESAE